MVLFRLGGRNAFKVSNDLNKIQGIIHRLYSIYLRVYTKICEIG
jgi:hypothetical protein